MVAVERIGVGDRIRPGEKVPADGKVLDARSVVDEALVTCESMPIAKAVGDVERRNRELVGLYYTPGVRNATRPL